MASFDGKLSHDFYMGVYILDENQVSGASLIYFHGYSVEFKGNKDVYYLNLDNMRMYVYRAKRKDSGCSMVRDTNEYMRVYDTLKSLGVDLDDSKLPAYI